MLVSHRSASPGGGGQTARRFRGPGRPALLPSVAWAFLVRGAAIYASYRAKVSLGLLSLLLSVVTFAYVGRVVDGAGPGFLERHGINYTSFVLIGTIVHGIAASGLGAFRAAVRREQVQGTLESLACSRVPFPVLVLFSGIPEIALVALGGTALLAAGTLVLGLSVAVSPVTLLGVLMYVLSMSGIGLASAGVVLVTKEGEPVSWAVGALTGLLGCVYFPLDLLPSWLARAARVLPTAHALRLARFSSHPLHTGDFSSLTTLAVTAAISIVVGALVLSWGYRRARRTGALAEY
jgi:ABC-2 type transport system permease protein